MSKCHKRNSKVVLKEQPWFWCNFFQVILKLYQIINCNCNVKMTCSRISKWYQANNHNFDVDVMWKLVQVILKWYKNKKCNFDVILVLNQLTLVISKWWLLLWYIFNVKMTLFKWYQINNCNFDITLILKWHA
jgi:hypothetical protein